MEKLNVNIITIENYSEFITLGECFVEEMDIWVKEFSNFKPCYNSPLKTVLKFMLDEYKVVTLLWFFGNLPYIFLDPALNFQKLESMKKVNALIGFQAWQYEEILKNWPIDKFPLYLRGNVKRSGKRYPKTGPFPIQLHL